MQKITEYIVIKNDKILFKGPSIIQALLCRDSVGGKLYTEFLDKNIVYNSQKV